jgi:hypothetical protein
LTVPPVINVWFFPRVSALGAAAGAVSIALGLRLWRAIHKSGHLDQRKKE